MPLSPDDYLSTPANYATPEQINASREYAKQLMQGTGQQPVHHWAQGVSNMVGTLLGAQRFNKAAQQQTQNTFGAGQDIAAVQPPGTPQQPMPHASADTPSAGAGPASVRNNNPGAQWPGPVASKFGATGSQTIGGHNQIAQFPDPVSGAAAEFALLDKNYTGMPLGAAIGKWSGGNSALAYTNHIAQRTGLAPDTVITPQLLRSPQGIALGKAMADWEAGGKSPLNDQQWAQAHQKAFGQPGGGQTADASGAIGGSSPPQIGSPQAMAGALSGGGAQPGPVAAASGGHGPIPGVSPPIATEGNPTFGPQYANQRAHIGQGQMGRLLGNQWVPSEIRDSLYQQYMMQNQPIEAAGPGGRWIIPSGGGKPMWVPELQKGELEAAGAKAPFMGTTQPGKDGQFEFQGMPGMPGIGPTQSKPPPDLSGLPDMHPQPAGKPAGPQSSLAPTGATAAQQASPMGQQAAAGAASAPEAGPGGAKTALAVPGNTASDAPPIGGMLGTPPPAAPEPKPAAGPQTAQASGAIPSLTDLANFGLGVKQKEELNKEDVKKYTENSNATMQAGQQAHQGLSMIKMAKQAVQDPKYYSGIGADAVVNLKRLKAAIGDDPNAAAANEIFEKGMAGDVLSQLRSKLQGLGQVRLAEIDLLSRATANKYNTPAANMAVLNIIERGYNQMNEMSQIADAYSGGARLDAKGNWVQGNDPPTNAGLNEVVNKYLTRHPLFNPEEIKGFNQTFDLDKKVVKPAGHGPQPMAPGVPSGFNSTPPVPPGNWTSEKR